MSSGRRLYYTASTQGKTDKVKFSAPTTATPRQPALSRVTYYATAIMDSKAIRVGEPLQVLAGISLRGSRWQNSLESPPAKSLLSIWGKVPHSMLEEEQADTSQILHRRISSDWSQRDRQHHPNRTTPTNPAPTPSIRFISPDPFFNSKTRKGTAKTKPTTPAGKQAPSTQPDAGPSRSTQNPNAEEEMVAQRVAALEFALDNPTTELAPLPPARRRKTRQSVNYEDMYSEYESSHYMDSD